MKSCASYVLAFLCMIAVCAWPARGAGAPAVAASVIPEETEKDTEKLSIPAANLPILEKAVNPDSFVLGPYDRLVIAIMGPEPRTHSLGVLPEGDILIPGIGPIKADGLTLSEFRRGLASKVEKYFHNIELYCYLESPALFRVFVTGEVVNPGSVAVSSVERVIDALGKAGSVKEGGSLRSITLERGGSSIRIDLLRFLVRGDLKNNPFLRSGDRIHVPSAGWHASIAGQVHKPSGYEIIEGETINDLIELANGFTSEAIGDSLLLKRLGEDGEVRQSTVAASDYDMPLRDKDEVSIFDRLKDRRFVRVSGGTFRTGQFELARGEGLSSLIVRAGGFIPAADLSSAYLERRNGVVLRIDLKEYVSPEPEKDLLLEDGDVLTIPLIAMKVTVGGEVNTPGEFPYSSDLSVVQYIGLAGGPTRDGSVNRVVVYSMDGTERSVDRNAHLNRGDVIVVRKSMYKVFGDIFGGMIRLGTVVISIFVLTK